MTDSSRSVYAFGPFRLDESERLLLLGDEVVPLTPKAFELLLVLVENGGRALTKDELMKRVWPDSFVEEANLSHNIYKLREALGEGSSGEKYIQTLPRRGYRFVAKVGEVPDEQTDLIIEEHTRAHVVVLEDQVPEKIETTPHLPLLAKPNRSTRTPLLFFGGSALVLAIAIGLFLLWRARGSHAVSNAPLRSIAVLPFKPLVAGDRNESLEMGMADTLITRLSSLNQITVRPTSSIRKYTDPQQDSLAAGRELMVDSVLDGNIQKAGDQLRLTARLVRVSDGATIWTDKFDTTFTNIFAVQDGVSQKVAEALAPRLSGQEKQGLSKRHTENVEAYQLYLQGRYHWKTFRPDDFTSSINYYQAALEKDPKFALAYTGMAVSYSTIGIYGPLSARDARAKASAAARTAVELDGELAEAHIALGVVKLLYEWDWEGARREFERGLQLNPNGDGHTPYGYYLYTMGRWDEALAELKRTSDLNPGWQTANWDIWWALYASRRFDEAERACRQAIKLDPNDDGAYWILGQIQAQNHNYKEAIDTFEKAVALNNSNLRYLADLGYARARSGEKNRALGIIAQLKKSPAALAPYSIAEVFVGLGDKDQAFAWLDKAYEERFPFLSDFKVTPQFDDLRSDPRYGELAKRMNLSL